MFKWVGIIVLGLPVVFLFKPTTSCPGHRQWPPDFKVPDIVFTVIGGTVVVVSLAILGFIAYAYSVPQFKTEVGQPEPPVIRHEFALIRAAQEAHIPGWQVTNDGVIHQLTAAEAGFDSQSAIKEIDYGFCSHSSFYLFALTSRGAPVNGYIKGEAFAYATNPTYHPTPETCRPPDWTVQTLADLGDGRSFANVSIPVASPPSVPTAMPTVSSRQ